MKKMYDILLNMKDRFSEEDWLMMVEQAHSKGKITDDEMNQLLNTVNEDEKIEDL